MIHAYHPPVHPGTFRMMVIHAHIITPLKTVFISVIGVEHLMVITKKTPDPKKAEPKKMELKKADIKKVVAAKPAAKPATKPVSKPKK